MLSCNVTAGHDGGSGGVREGFIPVKGGRIWYRVVGADKPGLPLLTLHGGPGGTHFYLEPLEALAGERPVIFYDQLGCGNSDKPGDTTLWNMPRFVAELESLRKALNLERFHLLGQSWGTMLAVDYCLSMKPSGVVSLTMSGPCLSSALWIADQQHWISQMPAATGETIRKHEAAGDYLSPAYQEALMQFYNRHVCRTSPWPECLNRSLENFGKEVYEYMWGPSEFTVRGTLKDYDRTGDLRSLKVPVLFTCGEFDEASPSTVRFYQNQLPGSEVHVFMKASHEHHLESEGEYLEVVREFLHRAESLPHRN